MGTAQHCPRRVGEQGHPLIPALHALGQHDGLAAGAAHLHPDDFVAAFLDDLDLHLYEDERTGDLVGHHRTTGENYGGQDGAPITPQMIVAYMLVHDEAWQTVQAGGKRARAAK